MGAVTPRYFNTREEEDQQAKGGVEGSRGRLVKKRETRLEGSDSRQYSGVEIASWESKGIEVGQTAGGSKWVGQALWRRKKRNRWWNDSFAWRALEGKKGVPVRLKGALRQGGRLTAEEAFRRDPLVTWKGKKKKKQGVLFPKRRNKRDKVEGD